MSRIMKRNYLSLLLVCSMGLIPNQASARIDFSGLGSSIIVDKSKSVLWVKDQSQVSGAERGSVIFTQSDPKSQLPYAEPSNFESAPLKKILANGEHSDVMATRKIFSNQLPQYPTQYLLEQADPTLILNPDANDPNVFRSLVGVGSVIGNAQISDLTDPFGNDVVTWINWAEGFMVANSNAITQINSTIGDLSRANSNTLLFLTKNNSNAILALVDCCKNNSNAIINLDQRVTNNSNAIVNILNPNNTNSLASLIRYNSNTILKVAEDAAACCAANSNALLFLTKNNSNALLFLTTNNSNTLLFLDKNNSNTLLFLTKNNSNAIVWLDEQLQTIDHGPNNIVINNVTYDQQFDIYLSSTHQMFINNSVTYDGHGHTIHFANSCDNLDILHIAADATVTFTNVIFDNYRDQAFDLGAGANITFGNCTRLVLADEQVRDMPWVFQGETQVRGHDNRVHLDPAGPIIVRPNSMLTIQETSLVGLKNSNLVCEDSTSILRLKGTNICMSNDYSFTSGSIEFWQDNTIDGTNVFTYASASPSTVGLCSQLTLEGIGFIYAPPVANRELFQLSDASATLYLDGCSLNSTTTGMRLTRGVLFVDQRNSLINTGAVSLSEGFAFGDGNPDNDLTVQIKPGGSLDLIDGILDYQNVD